MDLEGRRETEEMKAKTGNFWTVMAHIVTVMVGSGVLALAWSFAQLGWIAGPTILLGFCGVTYYTSVLLADCYRYPDPVTGAPDRELINAVHCYLGPRKALWCAWVQYAGIWTTLVGCTITTTASISGMHRVQCLHNDGSGTCGMPGSWGLYLMVIFCVIEVPLSQLPSLDQVAWLSVAGVATSFGYSLIVLGLCLAKWWSHGGFHGTLAGAQTASPWDKLFNMFLAIGNIAFSYYYTDVLIEIQDTLKSPPAENKTMKKASFYGLGITSIFYLLLSVAGYAAFGDGAPGNLLTGTAFHEPFWLVNIANACVVVHFLTAYQVYAQAIFTRLENCVSGRWPAAWFVKPMYNVRVPMTSTTMSLSLMNLVLRTSVVVLTTLVATLMPFFNAVLGLVGAIGFWPLSVYFPVTMHITRLKIQRSEVRWWMLQAFSMCCLLISVGMGAASVRDVVDKLKGAALFKSNDY